MSSPNPYEFERSLRLIQRNRTGRHLESDLAEFLRRIGVDGLEGRDGEVARRFVAAAHENATWYVLQRRQESIKRVAYMVLTVALVVLLPIVTWFMPAASAMALDRAGVSQADPTSAAIITAQLTALLSGFFGIHRLVTAWMFRRNSAYAFWKASTELKALIYSIEDGFRLAAENGAPGRVRQVLRGGIQKAEAIVQEERETFFRSLEATAVDLDRLVARSTESAQTLVTRVSQPIIEEIASKQVAAEQHAGELRTAKRRLLEALTKRRLHEERLRRLRARRAYVAGADEAPLEANIEAQAQRLAESELEVVGVKASWKAVSSA